MIKHLIALLLAAACSGPASATGFVAIRVYANTPDIEPHTWTHLNVVSAKDKEFKLELKVSDTRRTSKVFAGYLPEGSYRLKGLAGLQSNPEMGPGFDFEVRTGALTNLGSLIYQPVGEGKATFVAYEKFDELSRVLRKEFPALEKDAGAVKPLGWSRANSENKGASGQAIPTSFQHGITGAVITGLVNSMNETEKRAAWTDAKDPALRVQIAKASTYSLNAAQELPDGELLAGSNLGQLLLRSKAGEWANFDLDDPRELTALYARNRLHITAGGEEGMLKQSADGGLTWTDVVPPVASGLVLHLAEVNGELFVMSVADGRLYLHSRMNTAGAEWTELRNVPGIGVLAYANMPGRAAIHNGKYLMVLPSQEIHYFDVEKRSWTVSAVPQEVQDIRSNGESLYSASFFQKPHHSLDGGAKWNKLGDVCKGFAPIVLDFAMLNQRDAWAVCLTRGAFVASSRIRKSKDGGQTWIDLVDETPLKISKLVVTNTALVYMDRDTRIFSSTDGGRTWTRDKRKFQ